MILKAEFPDYVNATYVDVSVYLSQNECYYKYTHNYHILTHTHSDTHANKHTHTNAHMHKPHTHAHTHTRKHTGLQTQEGLYTSLQKVQWIQQSETSGR